MVLDRLHSSALYTSAHGSLRPSKSPSNSPITDIVLCFKYHARQITQHHFDPAEASSRTVHILHADTDSLAGANFPSFLPGFFRIVRRLSLLRFLPSTRICAGTNGASVRPNFSFSTLGTDPGKGERLDLQVAFGFFPV